VTQGVNASVNGVSEFVIGCVLVEESTEEVMENLSELLTRYM
jgi:hypothetical protein